MTGFNEALERFTDAATLLALSTPNAATMSEEQAAALIRAIAEAQQSLNAPQLRAVKTLVGSSYSPAAALSMRRKECTTREF